MLTLFPKFKTRLILFEGLFVALIAALYLLKPTMNPIAMILMLIVGCLFIAARAVHQRREHAQPPAQPAV